jgi:hypothetical protein
VADEPEVIFNATEFEQIAKSGPASALGGLALKVIVTRSDDEAQGLFVIVHLRI